MDVEFLNSISKVSYTNEVGYLWRKKSEIHRTNAGGLWDITRVYASLTKVHYLVPYLFRTSLLLSPQELIKLYGDYVSQRGLDGDERRGQSWPYWRSRERSFLC